MARDRDELRLDDFAGQFPPLLTTRRAVAFTGMSRHAIGRAVKGGQLPVAGRRGRTFIFRRTDLEQWLCGASATDDDRSVAPIVSIAAVRRRAPISDSLARIRRAAGRDDGCGFRKFWVMDSGNFDHLRRPCHATGGGGKVVAVHDREWAVLATR